MRSCRACSSGESFLSQLGLLFLLALIGEELALEHALRADHPDGGIASHGAVAA
jgi:Kef-type K+ transport system membrane component KefB